MSEVSSSKILILHISGVSKYPFLPTDYSAIYEQLYRRPPNGPPNALRLRPSHSALEANSEQKKVSGILSMDFDPY